MNNSTVTPHEIPGNFQYAGFAKRLKAFSYDYLIICAYIILLVAATIVAVKTAGFMGLSLRWPQNPPRADLMAFVTLILPVIMYYTLSESSPKQATWGKRKVGIQVVNADGGRLNRIPAFVRALVKLLPWQIGHTCLFHIPGWPLAVTSVPPEVIAGFVLLYVLVGIYIASALISKKHRTPYDWAAGSYVVIAEAG